jgi:hypothetical protein
MGIRCQSVSDCRMDCMNCARRDDGNKVWVGNKASVILEDGTGLCEEGGWQDNMRACGCVCTVQYVWRKGIKCESV